MCEDEVRGEDVLVVVIVGGLDRQCLNVSA